MSALVSAQQAALSIENLIRRDIDVFFDTTPSESRLKQGYALTLAQKERINALRKTLETIIARWEVWLNTGNTTSGQVVVLVTDFEKELRMISGILREVLQHITTNKRDFHWTITPSFSLLQTYIKKFSQNL